jgi:DNA-binding response OmpR family regulator
VLGGAGEASGAVTEVGGVAGRPLVALVVENDAPVRQLLDAILQTQGWERVLGGAWDEPGVREAAAWVDLLVLDHRLPGTTGLEVLVEVKATRPALRVLMLTGDLDVQEEAERLGVDAFLRKPFDVAELVAVLRAPADDPIDLRPTRPADVDVRSVDTPWFTSS